MDGWLDGWKCISVARSVSTSKPTSIYHVDCLGELTIVWLASLDWLVETD